MNAVKEVKKSIRLMVGDGCSLGIVQEIEIWHYELVVNE